MEKVGGAHLASLVSSANNEDNQTYVARTIIKEYVILVS